MDIWHMSQVTYIMLFLVTCQASGYSLGHTREPCSHGGLPLEPLKSETIQRRLAWIFFFIARGMCDTLAVWRKFLNFWHAKLKRFTITGLVSPPAELCNLSCFLICFLDNPQFMTMPSDFLKLQQCWNHVLTTDSWTSSWLSTPEVMLSQWEQRWCSG